VATEELLLILFDEGVGLRSGIGFTEGRVILTLIGVDKIGVSEIVVDEEEEVEVVEEEDEDEEVVDEVFDFVAGGLAAGTLRDRGRNMFVCYNLEKEMILYHRVSLKRLNFHF
jgi:hypothetical protein